MNEQQRLFRIHGEEETYTGLLRFYSNFEGTQFILEALVDVSNQQEGSRKKELVEQNHKLPRLSPQFFHHEQEELVGACMDHLSILHPDAMNSLETAHIGFRAVLEPLDVEKEQERFEGEKE